MRIFETKKIVPILQNLDINDGVDCDSINMANFKHAAFICLFGADLSGNAVLTLYSGATDGAKTSAVTFTYAYGGAAVGSANCDVLSTPATSAALTATGTTFVSRMLVIEFDPGQITDGHDWLTLNIGSEASAGKLSVIAVLDPKYPSEAGNSALT